MKRAGWQPTPIEAHRLEQLLIKAHAYMDAHPERYKPRQAWHHIDREDAA